MKWGTWINSPLQSPGATSRVMATLLFLNPKESVCLLSGVPWGWLVDSGTSHGRPGARGSMCEGWWMRAQPRKGGCRLSVGRGAGTE